MNRIVAKYQGVTIYEFSQSYDLAHKRQRFGYRFETDLNASIECATLEEAKRAIEDLQVFPKTPEGTRRFIN